MPDYCADCTRCLPNHAADCPTQLRTREQRVARAAHILQCFYRWRAIDILEGEGISHEEIVEGAAIAEKERERRAELRRVYGDPAYGGGRW